VSRQGQPLEELNIGRSLLEVSRSAGDTGLFVPSQLSLLGKTLMQLDEIGRALDPQFDPNASIKRNVSTLVSQRMLKTASQGNLFTSLLETKSLMLALPSRLGRILDAVANAELEVRVKSPDARIVVEGIEKIANRITVGLILAALIVGAALLMRVDTSFRLFGYPGFAMVCFVVAGVGGGWLVLSTLLRDHESKRKREKSSR
jgi:ubiquinone biosynthesis protein